MRNFCQPRLGLANAVASCALLLSALALCAQTNIPNPLIDYDTFLAGAGVVGKLRAQRRVSEETFIQMAAQPGTIVFELGPLIDIRKAKLAFQGTQAQSP